MDSSDDEVENVTVIEQSQAKTNTKPTIKKTIKKPETEPETEEDEEVVAPKKTTKKTLKKTIKKPEPETETETEPETDEDEEEDSKNIVKKYVIPKKKITKQEQEENRHTLYVYDQTTLINKINEDITDFKKRNENLSEHIAQLKPSKVTDKMKKALSFKSSDLSVSLDYAYKTIKQVKNTNTFMVYNDEKG